MRSFITLALLLLFAACAKKPAQEIADAIEIAKDYLTHYKCEEAIKVLEEVGRQNDDPVYLMTLASAYSCRGGFDALSFLNHDIDVIGSADPENIMQTLVTLSTSTETTTDSPAYTDMKAALKVLLESNSGTQGHAARVAIFGPRKAGEMGVQVLLLSMVQLGKFLNHFGDVDQTGKKGAQGNNSCFINYSYPAAQAALTQLPAGNACTGVNEGHVDLDISTAEGKRRLCEGLTLFTNVVDVLSNIDLSNNSTMAPLMDVADAVNEMKQTALALDASLGTLLNMSSQSSCETTLNTAAERNNMELIFAALFEAGLP